MEEQNCTSHNTRRTLKLQIAPTSHNYGLWVCVKTWQCVHVKYIYQTTLTCKYRGVQHGNQKKNDQEAFVYFSKQRN
jgi:hypothetical protein